MLPSPRDVVVGASDLDDAAEFLQVFGFQEYLSTALPADAARALYGLDGETGERMMIVPGAELGRIRLVTTPHPARSFAPFDARPFAIDLFTTDMERSVALAEEHGYHTSPVTDHVFGPVRIREVEIIGPDRLVMTLLEPSAGRRSSILDKDPDRLHSEVHAFVWNDVEIDAPLEYWQQCGLEKSMDAVLETPGMGALVGVPEEDIKLRLTVLADGESNPIRVEFVEFLGKPSTPQPSLPLAAGLHAPAFEVDDLDATRAAMGEAEFGEVVTVDTAIHSEMRAATAVSPQGHRFEVWAKE
jgi:hypothetical protein